MGEPFASDFVYMAPGLPAVTHRQELMDVARAGFRNQASVRIEPVEIRVCGDWAFARANVTGSVKLHTTGEVIAVDVKELIVLARSGDGAWQIARLMNNANK